MSTPTPSLMARLGSVVLVFEAIVAFLGGLVIYGLKALPWGIAPWWGIVGGTVVAVLMIVTAGVTRFRWGIKLGWALQFTFLACAFFNLAFILVFIVFGGLWFYSMTTAARLSKQAPPQSTESE